MTERALPHIEPLMDATGPHGVQCLACGAREVISDGVLMLLGQRGAHGRREGVEARVLPFIEAHAQCPERIARAARRLDALEGTGIRREALGG